MQHLVDTPRVTWVIASLAHHKHIFIVTPLALVAHDLIAVFHAAIALAAALAVGVIAQTLVWATVQATVFRRRHTLVRLTLLQRQFEASDDPAPLRPRHLGHFARDALDHLLQVALLVRHLREVHARRVIGAGHRSGAGEGPQGERPRHLRGIASVVEEAVEGMVAGGRARGWQRRLAMRHAVRHAVRHAIRKRNRRRRNRSEGLRVRRPSELHPLQHGTRRR